EPFSRGPGAGCLAAARFEFDPLIGGGPFGAAPTDAERGRVDRDLDGGGSVVEDPGAGDTSDRARRHTGRPRRCVSQDVTRAVGAGRLELPGSDDVIDRVV